MNEVCRECKDRWVSNTSRCHDTCVRYQVEKAKADARREASMVRRQGDVDWYGSSSERAERIRKYRHRHR